MDDYYRAFWADEAGTAEINSLWDLNPVALQPPAQYRQQAVVDPQYQIGGFLPDGKNVVIADHLEDGEVYLTAGEIILNSASWQGLIATIERQQYCHDVVRGIVETQLRRELAWLREAGHAV